MAERQTREIPGAPNIPAPILDAARQIDIEGELHELRVRIPVDLHRQLLSLKVLRGRSLAETVSLALDIYFQERQEEADEATADKKE